jgi:hypothetical protein
MDDAFADSRIERSAAQPVAMMGARLNGLATPESSIRARGESANEI